MTKAYEIPVGTWIEKEPRELTRTWETACNSTTVRTIPGEYPIFATFTHGHTYYGATVSAIHVKSQWTNRLFHASSHHEDTTEKADAWTVSWYYATDLAKAVKSGDVVLNEKGGWIIANIWGRDQVVHIETEVSTWFNLMRDRSVDMSEDRWLEIAKTYYSLRQKLSEWQDKRYEEAR